MKIVGIICEYNPFHLGHKKQFDIIRRHFQEEVAIVCLMSGNFVQRGMPAIVDKSLRARAAIDCGADLVLELPATYALRSAEGFAAGGVEILSGFCDYLCFGCETGDSEKLLATARALLSSEFSLALREELDKGLSFPVARQNALMEMGADASCLSNPNDILGVEYCKAILSQNSPLLPLPIHREGSYHAELPDGENPSATAVRSQMLAGESWQVYVPAGTETIFSQATLHSLTWGERAVLSRLRSMTEEEWESIPFGSEGLWRKLMSAARSCSTLEEILAATKSKRYTRTRLDRMVMCAYLGITRELLESPVPYVRVLGFRQNATGILKRAREIGLFPHTGEKMDHPYQAMELLWDDLYGLFGETPVAPGQTHRRRAYICGK